MALAPAAGGPPLADEGDFELLDVYDENGHRLGVKPRVLVHRDGDWHRTFSCWVVAEDDGQGPSILLQRRGPYKEVWPQRFDISAAGHYRAGEGVAEGVRELAEELGVEASLDALIPLGTRIGVARYAPPRALLLGTGNRQGGVQRPLPPAVARVVIDREFQETFLLMDRRPLEAYGFRPPEVEGLALLAVRDGLALFGGEVDAVTAPGLTVQWSPLGEPHGDADAPLLSLVQVQYRLTAADFVPSVDRYLYKILLLAERALRGERPLLI